jgi:alkyl sulfatase BDS1-like metallo-beta-lactamase superfamily hydrolase
VAGFQAPKPDLTLTLNRTDLEAVMMGAITVEAQITAGTTKAEGDASILGILAKLMVEFDPRFEIIPGTKAGTAVMEADADSLQAVPGAPMAE